MRGRTGTEGGGSAAGASSARRGSGAIEGRGGRWGGRGGMVTVSAKVAAVAVMAAVVLAVSGWRRPGSVVVRRHGRRRLGRGRRWFGPRRRAHEGVMGVDSTRIAGLWIGPSRPARACTPPRKR